MEQTKKSKIITIVVCFLVAVGLWAYVINELNPIETIKIRLVEVDIVGEQSLLQKGYAIADKDYYTVDFTVTGGRKELEGLNALDFKAKADVSSFSIGENELKVTVDAPKGITVNEISSEKIIVQVENYVGVERSTKIFFTDAGAGYEETLLSEGPKTITVRGAQSDVDKVAYIKFDLLSELLERDILKTVSLKGVAVDEDGKTINNVYLDQRSIAVDAVIYTVKSVQFSPVLVGESLYGPDGIASFECPTAISIKGTAADLLSVSNVLSEAINIEGVSEDGEYQVIPDLPKGVMLSRGQQELKGVLTISTEAKEAYEALQAEAQNNNN